MQVGTLNYMSPEAILGGSNNIRGGPPMKVLRLHLSLTVEPDYHYACLTRTRDIMHHPCCGEC